MTDALIKNYFHDFWATENSISVPSVSSHPWAPFHPGGPVALPLFYDTPRGSVAESRSSRSTYTWGSQGFRGPGVSRAVVAGREPGEGSRDPSGQARTVVSPRVIPK